ncbi:outer membrane protein assembly factor BamA [Pseudothioclava nitratireducens]|uniref:outer membrane protein assembly factor BamA n=1 Tax=Pseudothioclava nitratireducens TaxID=1928646 RepID=UPI003B8470A5
MMKKPQRAKGPGMARSLLGSAAIFLAMAVTSPDIASAQSYSFSALQIEGNERIEAQTIITYAGIARGATLSAGALNDAYQRLQGSGLFESVELVPQGNTLVIRVSEYPTVNIVNFEGNKKLKDEALAEIVSTQSRKIYSPAAVEADAAKIVEAYAAAGRLAARVDPKVIRRDGNRVDVAFEIKEGKVTEIERISFTGNRAYSDRRLRRVLATKQAGILRTFVQRDTFVPERVEFDRQLLTDFYRSRGYVDVQVTGVSSEMARDRDGFFMTFNIREGQQFKFGAVTTVSEIPELDVAEFERLAKIRSGVIYSPAAVDLAITRMEEQALRKGANFVRVEPRITRNERDRTLDIEFALVRGPRIFVERIDIEGNNTTLDRVVRRQFRTVEGDPFNPREIRASAERIRALGFFSNAEVEARQGSADDQVVVDVNLEEQPTGALSFGAAYGAESGLGLSINLQESNFLGRGQYVGLSVSSASSDKGGSLTFIEPAFLGRDLKFAFRGSYSTTENANSNYSTKMMSLSPSIEFPVSRNGRFELRYTLARDELFDVDRGDPANPADNGSSILLQNEEDNFGQLWKSGLGYSYTYDTRNTGLDPRYGVLFRFGQDYYGLGGDYEGIMTTALLRGQRKVFQEEVTLKATLEGGVMHSLGDSESRILERFSGNGVMRGFERNGIGPRDVTATNQDALGGKYYAVASVEAEFPLGLPSEYNLSGAVFFDVGSVWGLENTAGTAGTVDDDLHWRSVVGASLLWSSPIGPLRLDFTKALEKESYDKEQTFDLTITTEF